MNLLTFAARKFEIPLTHTLHRTNKEQVYDLKRVSFSANRLVAIYGDEHKFRFDVIMRGLA